MWINIPDETRFDLMRVNIMIIFQALEDAIYFLGQALARGQLDLDAFLRQVLVSSLFL